MATWNAFVSKVRARVVKVVTGALRAAALPAADLAGAVARTRSRMRARVLLRLYKVRPLGRRGPGRHLIWIVVAAGGEADAVARPYRPSSSVPSSWYVERVARRYPALTRPQWQARPLAHLLVLGSRWPSSTMSSWRRQRPCRRRRGSCLVRPVRTPAQWIFAADVRRPDALVVRFVAARRRRDAESRPDARHDDDSCCGRSCPWPNRRAVPCWTGTPAGRDDTPR